MVRRCLAHIILLAGLVVLPACSPALASMTDLLPAAPGKVAGGESIGDAYSPELGNTGYDVKRYTLRFTLDPLVYSVIAARATIEAASTLDDLGQISLDFKGFDISSLTVSGKAAAYERSGGKLTIHLPRRRNIGQPFTIDVVYSGRPLAAGTAYDGYTTRMGFEFQPSYRVLFTQSEPDGAELWYPCNNHQRDKALFRFELTVPDGMTGVANGHLVKDEQNLANSLPGGKVGDRFTWEEAYPMATYLAVIAVGKFEKIESKSPAGIPLRSFVLPADKAAFTQATAQIGDAIDWMSAHFGPYPFGEFGYVEIGPANYSMEDQTMVAFPQQGNFDIAVHELAHHWFGDWVTPDSWADIWRNEGFATYITAVYLYRDNPGGLEGAVKSWQAHNDNNHVAYPLNKPQMGHLFDWPSYERGALLAHDLHQTMGDAAFYQGLKAYFKDYGGKTASQAEFQAELEKAAGKPLDAVFAKWFAPAK